MPLERPPAPGEVNQHVGDEGTRKAKLWLDSTTRVKSSYTNMDDNGANYLAYDWPYGGQPYSYDLGGILRGRPYENQMFVAESKKYANANDQGSHFDKFLAQSYCTLLNHSRMVQHFMWITWSPFRVNTWSELHSPGKVRRAVIKNSERVFGVTVSDEIESRIDEELINAVSDRVWIVVLSDKQANLVISPQDRAELAKIWLEREVGSAN